MVTRHDQRPSDDRTTAGPRETGPTDPSAAPPRRSRRRHAARNRATRIDPATEAAIRAAAAALVAIAPPLAETTRARLATLLSTSTTRFRPGRRPAK
ncbi:MAG: hypothetical protein HKP61_19490 [Dactylosporangium sp.]|nr:hypothetical protein [Dactylosporangium sp.]